MRPLLIYLLSLVLILCSCRVVAFDKDKVEVANVIDSLVDGVDNAEEMGTYAQVIYGQLKGLGGKASGASEKLRHLLRHLFAVAQDTERFSRKGRAASAVEDEGSTSGDGDGTDDPESVKSGDGMDEFNGDVEATSVTREDVKILNELEYYVFYMLQSLLGPASPLARSLYLTDHLNLPKSDKPALTKTSAYYLFVNFQVIKGAVMTLKRIMDTFVDKARIWNHKVFVVTSPEKKLKPVDEEVVNAHNTASKQLLPKILESLRAVTARLSRVLLTISKTEIGKKAAADGKSKHNDTSEDLVPPYMNSGDMANVVKLVNQVEVILNPVERCVYRGLGDCLDTIGCRWDWCAESARDSSLDHGRCVPKQYYTVSQQCCELFGEKGQSAKMGIDLEFFKKLSFGKPESIASAEHFMGTKKEFLKNLCELQPACVLIGETCTSTSKVPVLPEIEKNKIRGAFQDAVAWFDLGSSLHRAISEAVQSTVSQSDYEIVKNYYKEVKTSIDNLQGAVRSMEGEEADRMKAALIESLLHAMETIEKIPSMKSMTSWGPLIPANHPIREVVLKLKRVGRLTGLLDQQLVSQECVVEESGYC